MIKFRTLEVRRCSSNRPKRNILLHVVGDVSDFQAVARELLMVPETLPGGPRIQTYFHISVKTLCVIFTELTFTLVVQKT